MHNYLSDITREEFEMIRMDLENTRKKTKPRKIDLYDVFFVVLYVIKSGCQWRMLPADFPKWKTVYFYYCIWASKREDGTTLLSEVLKKIVTMIRSENLCKDKMTFGIIDVQSVQNADTAKEKGYDAGKKTSGIKRHIVVDTQRLPHAIIVTTANVTDRQGVIEMITLNLEK